VGFWKTVAWTAFTPLAAMGFIAAIGYTGLPGGIIYFGLIVGFLYKTSHKPKGNGGDSKISPDRQQKAIDRHVAEVKNE